ncbi:MAG: hypothetical protein E7184_01620 [Erysipelotrichaceae bacterium]|nr:hypothetical protein [Erysipelotrichaceae bacterium]
MILIKILGERTDVASYLSYYAKVQLNDLLKINEDDILFEVVVSDYFVDGDLKGYGGIVIEVTIEKEHNNKKEEIAKILNSFCSYFETKTWIKFNVLDKSDSFVFESAEVKHFDKCGCESNCHCHEEKCECGCECGPDCDCGCQEGKECTCEHDCKCGSNCHCHEEKCECGCECGPDCDCGCQEGKECICEHDCKCGSNCHCHEEKCECGCECGPDCDCGCQEGKECTCEHDCKCESHK